MCKKSPAPYTLNVPNINGLVTPTKVADRDVAPRHECRYLTKLPVGDYDRRVVILSRELGKIAAFAKGARRPNSHLIGVTRPFIFGTFEVYRGRDSYTIQKANVTNYFEELVSDLDGVLYGYYFAELAEYYGRENLDAHVKGQERKRINIAIGAVELKLNGYTDMTQRDDECELGYWLAIRN